MVAARTDSPGTLQRSTTSSEKGPPRKVYTLNAQGREQLEGFFRTWSFLSDRIGLLQTDIARATTTTVNPEGEN